MERRASSAAAAGQDDATSMVGQALADQVVLAAEPASSDE